MSNEQQKAKELAKLLNAFSEGKQLQFLNDDGYWCDYQATIKDIVEEFLYLDNVQIRIKPETRRMDLTEQDLIDRMKLGFEYMWVRNTTSGYSFLITGIKKDRVVFDGMSEKTYGGLSDDYVWLIDGTPCYKEVECE